MTGGSIEAAGELAYPLTYQGGEGAFDHDNGFYDQPWAALSSTVVDPVDDTVWTVQEFATTENRWRLAVAHVGSCSTTRFCNPSSGSEDNPATIEVSACRLEDSVSVTLSNGPVGQLTYLLIGDGSAVLHDPPGAVGDLCVAGGTCLGRYTLDAGPIDGSGSFTTELAHSASGGPNYGIPSCGGRLQPGETWSFQYWHRNPSGAPSGFSEAIAVTFR